MTQRPQRFDQDNDADIVGWFDALGPPPKGRMSPHLRTQVLTRIEQRRARRRLWRWLPHGQVPLWRFAMVTALLLSVGLNVWWGMSTRSAPPAMNPSMLQTYRFLQDIERPDQLGSLVTARAAFGEHVIGLGFAPLNSRIMFFRLGTIYADALAALRGDASDVAGQRLDALRQMLERLQAPDILVAYLRELQMPNSKGPQDRERQAKLLALFEGLYQIEYAADEPTAATVLFQLGAWLENMALAAAAQDAMALRQEAAAGYFQAAVRQIGAPQEVLAALKRLRRGLMSASMTDDDIRRLLTLVREIQQMLGEV